MKKNISLLFIIVFLFIGIQVFACNSVPGTEYPTLESMLSRDDTAIGIYKITSGGQDAIAQLVLGNVNAKMQMHFKTNISSCGTKSEDFVVGQYIVAIFNKNDDSITYLDPDDQFTFEFSSQESASNKYSLLLQEWNDRQGKDKEALENKSNIYTPVGYSLKPGMKNDDVLALQKALKSTLGLGNDFKLDGSYGPATTAAVKQFQVSKGLKDDGIAGVLTQGKLKEVVGRNEEVKEIDDGNEVSSVYTPVDYSLKPGMKNDDVLALQKALKSTLGLGNDFKLDGSYGPATTAAVKQFQVSKGLKDDGIAGVLTQGKLKEVVGVENNGDDTQPTEGDQEQSTEGDQEHDSEIDAELRKVLLRAKNEIIYYAVGEKNYTDAYELVSGYNNTFLDIYSGSDPLYKSSGGGLYFVYSLKLTNGEYLCADNNYKKEITQKKERPNMDTDQVSC